MTGSIFHTIALQIAFFDSQVAKRELARPTYAR